MGNPTVRVLVIAASTAIVLTTISAHACAPVTLAEKPRKKIAESVPASPAPSPTSPPAGSLGKVIGAFWDQETGRLHIVGDGQDFYGSPSEQDIAVALKWATGDAQQAPFVSIDPNPTDTHERAMNVRLSDDARNTSFGWTMFEADRLLKSLSIGHDGITGRALVSTAPGFKNTLELAGDGASIKSEVWSRFWLHPAAHAEEASSTALRIRSARIAVSTETMKLVGGKLIPSNSTWDPIAEEFARFVSQNYEILGREFPVLRRLEQLFRLLLVAEWVRANQIPFDWQWMAERSEEHFTVPESTPALQTKLTRTRRTSTAVARQTLSVFGGVSFAKIELRPAKADLTAFAEDVRRAAAGNDRGRPSIALYSIGAGKKATEPVVNYVLPEGGTLRVQARRNRPRSAQQLGELELEMPRLIGINPTGREGHTQYTKVEGRDAERVPVRRYQLFDAAGALTGTFERHEVDQGRGEIVVLPQDSRSNWRLLPQGESLVRAIESPEHQLIFESRTGRLVGEQVGAQLIRYKSNDRGTLDKITLELRGGKEEALFQGIHTSNGARLVELLPASAARPRNEPKKTQRLNIKLPGSERELDVRVDLSSGNYTSEKSSRLDILERHLSVLLPLLSNQGRRPAIVSDGGKTLVLSPDRLTLTVLDASVRDPQTFAAAYSRQFPEDRTFRGAELGENGESLILFQVGGVHEVDVIDRVGSTRPIEGRQAFTTYMRAEALRLTHDFVIGSNGASAWRVENMVHLRIGEKTRELAAEEVSKLLSGGSSKVIEDLTRELHAKEVLFFRSALHRGHPDEAPNKDEFDPTIAIASYLAAQHGGADGLSVRLATDRQTALSNRLSIKPVSQPSELTAVVAGKLDPDRRRAVDRALGELQRSGARVVETLEKDPGQQVLLISGHNGQELIAHLRMLGANGSLESKTIILNMCYSERNADLISEMIMKYGARAVLHQGEVIRPDAVALVVRALSEELSRLPADGLPADKLWRRAIDRAIDQSRTELREKMEIDELEKLRKGVLQLSQREARSPGSLAEPA